MAPTADSPADICVIGLGYIGLPTAAFFASTGVNVVGVDLNQKLVDKVNAGVVPFVEPGFGDFLTEVVASSRLTASTETSPARTFIIAVPTPFNADRSVDDSFVFSAADRVIPHLAGGELIILESTSPPGLTERIAERVMDQRPDLTVEEGQPNSVYFAHAPERVLPGRIMEEMVSNDRIVGGTTGHASRLAKALYQRFCKGEVLSTDARTAEMAKLTENSFRDVNIAFANELSMICEDLNINVWELIRLANHHPRVNILQPGPGVGGHCIAVDPWFIVSSSPRYSHLIKTARDVNDSKPEFVLTQVHELLDAQDQVAGSTSVAVLGLAFKPDIDDLRESPAVEIVKRLASDHPEINFLAVEPNIAELPPALANLNNVRLAEFEQSITDANLTLLLVDHTEFKQAKDRLSTVNNLIDTRGLLN